MFYFEKIELFDVKNFSTSSSKTSKNKNLTKKSIDINF